MYLKVTAVGVLGRDVELRYTPQGTAVASFSVATNRKYKSGEEQKEETTWLKVTVWARLAELCAEYLHKGSKCLVEGTLVPDEHGGPKVWTAQDGTPRASFEIRASEIRFLDSKKKEAEPQGEL